MFGYVKQENFDAERAARIEAERQRDEAVAVGVKIANSMDEKSLQLLEWKELYNGSIKSREIEAAMHAAQISELLQHIAPLQPERPPPDVIPYKAPTYDEIMAEPASTKREMFYREIRASRARELAYSEAEREAVRIRNENMTAEEREAMRPDSVYDAVLGVAMPVAKDGADNVN